MRASHAPPLNPVECGTLWHGIAASLFLPQHVAAMERYPALAAQQRPPSRTGSFYSQRIKTRKGIFGRKWTKNPSVAGLARPRVRSWLIEAR